MAEGRSAAWYAVGYEFTQSLIDAIEAVTAELEATTPGAFRYRGANLQRAVTCQLYARLSGREDLLREFAERRGVPSADTRLEAAVIARVLGAKRPARGGVRAATLRTGRRVRWRIAPRTWGEPGRGQGEPRPVAFVLDHPKFLNFLEPVLAGLPDPPIVVAMAPGHAPVRRLPRTRDIPAPSARTLPRPQMDQAGPGLGEGRFLCSHYERLAAILERERPAAVVVVEGNSPYDELANQAAQVAEIPCVCIQQGWSPIFHNGFRDMAYTSMLVWGEGFRDLLREHNPEQTFEITGSPVFDERAAETGSGSELRRLVAGRPGLAVFLQGSSQLISPQHREDLLWIAIESAKRLPEVSVLMREHPGHPLETAWRELVSRIPNVILTPPAAFAMRDVLDASVLSLSIYSTTLLESAALGRPPVVFNPTALPRGVPDLEAIGAGIERRNKHEALQQVVGLMQNEEARAPFASKTSEFAEHFFAGARPGAADRIRECIELAAAA